MDVIFVYGTLRQGGARGKRHLLGANVRRIGDGRTRGTLIDLGEYPGLLPQPFTLGDSAASTDWVTGEVYELADPAEDLARLDAYEGCAAHDAPPHEFERIRLPVMLEGGRVIEAWVYVYRWDADGKPRITSGDYGTRD